MKKVPLLLLFALLPAAAQTRPAASSGPAAPSGWILTFSDDFNTALDLTKWSPHDPSGAKRSGPLALAAPEASAASDGAARITATYTGGEPPYRSGIITTRATFSQLYGRFEVTLRAPAGRGLESLVQLRPTSLKSVPAIDILSLLGSDPKSAGFENRWGDERAERGFGDTWSGPDFSTAPHTIALEWDSRSLIWYVDGQRRFESREGVPQEPMFLAISLAVGTRRARVPGSEVAFPAVLAIDSVRVYRKP